MSNVIDISVNNYKALLEEYLETLNEKSLYKAEQVSKAFIKENVGPDEIINLHRKALIELYPEYGEYIQNSMHFLLETMISYGLAHEQLQTLKENQLKIKTEMAVAANMQHTLLSTTKPEIDGLDIGVVSVPAEQLNGDYHHFVKEEDGSLNVAIADVIGKGVPAALCMSMIKYSMESFPRGSMNPETILGSLNRVVEKNVDTNMFVTMFYAQYFPWLNKLIYSSAGHEPGFYYHAAEDKFMEIDSEGLVLGVLSDSTYKQYELEIEKNDMVILLTDGVTECRQGERFIETDEILEVIKKYAHLPAQDLVDYVFKHFERLQGFELKDDFTLIVLKKEV